MPQDGHSLQRHFEAACELGAAERRAYLDQLGDREPALAREVQRLLDLDSSAGPFLEASAWEQLQEVERAPLVPGRVVGTYRIMRPIASGGMGQVYEAEQDRPRRRVALKVLRLGLASERARLRFEDEAELLGRLEHPAIARIYEAGTLTENGEGLPFFAMEFVEGARAITSYADEEALDRRTRVRLFLDACRGVAHAHRRGIIHRDLKPANLLVDRSGDVKVIDFGVARAAESGVGTTEHRTLEGQLLGTPAWMSPEQCEGGAVETASDVYALGVVLHELLTGRLPIEVCGASFSEAMRHVHEDEPDLAILRTRDVSVDLVTIVGKCLEKEPGRRYSSASALGADVERFLSGFPIAARPPSTLYQLSKLARRHRGFVAGAVAVLLALTAGLVATSMQARRAGRAEDLAEQRLVQATREAEKLRRIQEFLESVFSSATPGVALGREITVREVTDAATARARSELADDPEVLLPVLLALSHSQFEMGDYQESRDMLEEVLEEARAELPATSPALARLELQLGRLRVEMEEPAAGAELIEAALARLQGFDAPLMELAGAHQSLGLAYRALGRLGEAREAHLRSLEIRRDLSDDDSFEIAACLHNLGVVAFEMRELARAEELSREAVAMARRVLPGRNPWLATALHSQASTLRTLGRSQEAAEAWREALAIQDSMLDSDHPLRALTLSNLAGALLDLRAVGEAERLLQEGLEIRRRSFGERSVQAAATLRELSRAASLRGDHERVRELLCEALEILREAEAEHGAGSDEGQIPVCLQSLALSRFRGGELEGALPLVREAIERQRRVLDPDHPELAGNLSLLGLIQTRLGRPAEAEPALREALAARTERLGDSHWMTANTQSVLGECLFAQGRIEEARPLLVEAAATLEAKRGPDDPLVLEAQERLKALRAGAGTEPD